MEPNNNKNNQESKEVSNGSENESIDQATLDYLEREYPDEHAEIMAEILGYN